MEKFHSDTLFIDFKCESEWKQIYIRRFSDAYQQSQVNAAFVLFRQFLQIIRQERPKLLTHGAQLKYLISMRMLFFAQPRSTQITYRFELFVSWRQRL